MAEFSLLGPIEARAGGLEVDLGGARQRAVLAALLIRRNAVVAADTLIEDVWGEEPPPTAATALQGHVSKLRRLLGPDVIETRPPGYVLHAGPADVDADRFEALVAAARDLPPRQAGVRLRQALALVRGPVLADLAWEPFAEAEVARLEALRLDALEARIDADLAAGLREPLVAELEGLVAEHPYRERLHAQRMLALYRAGRQADALSAYHAARSALDDGLGIDPGPELQELEARILRQDPDLLVEDASVEPPGNLPAPPAPIVGRQGELDDLARRLASGVRLVTLTGPGGTGKTRTALELAHRLAGEDPDGTWFVDLAPVTDAGAAMATLRAALGLPDGGGDPLPELVDALRPRRLLVVLDNLEQVSGVARPVAELLAAASGLRIVATSRSPLAIGAEVEYPLAPLGTGVGGGTIDPAAPPDAVALFAARAQAIQPAFELTAETAPAIAALCARLDGLPLAIELAASRLRVLTPGAILERLTAGLDVLRTERRDAPDRQRTLEATIAWSEQLLDQRGRRAFRRASVFVGGFTLDAFEAVCLDPGDDAIDVLEELVAGSLLVRSGTPSTPRFGFLETIRSVAAGRLRAAGDEAATRDRHLDVLRILTARTRETLHAPDADRRLAAFRAEHDNLMAALAWAAATNPDALVALAATAAEPWTRDRHLGEGRDWLRTALDTGAGTPADRALALRGLATITGAIGEVTHARALAADAVSVAGATGDDRSLAAALRVSAMLANDAGDLDAARRDATRALELATAAGDVLATVAARHELAFVTAAGGDLAGARDLLERNAADLRSLGDRTWLAATLANLGGLVSELGDLEAAERLSREGLALLEEMGDPASVASGLTMLGEVLTQEGRFVEARDTVREAIAITLDARAYRELPSALDAYADLCLRDGDPVAAARLLGHAGAVRTSGGQAALAGLDELGERIRSSLGDAAYEAALAAGAEQDVDTLLASIG